MKSYCDNHFHVIIIMHGECLAPRWLSQTLFSVLLTSYQLLVSLQTLLGHPKNGLALPASDLLRETQEGDVLYMSVHLTPTLSGFLIFPLDSEGQQPISQGIAMSEEDQNRGVPELAQESFHHHLTQSTQGKGWILFTCCLSFHTRACKPMKAETSTNILPY